MKEALNHKKLKESLKMMKILLKLLIFALKYKELSKIKPQSIMDLLKIMNFIKFIV